MLTIALVARITNSEFGQLQILTKSDSDNFQHIFLGCLFIKIDIAGFVSLGKRKLLRSIFQMHGDKMVLILQRQLSCLQFSFLHIFKTFLFSSIFSFLQALPLGTALQTHFQWTLQGTKDLPSFVVSTLELMVKTTKINKINLSGNPH